MALLQLQVMKLPKFPRVKKWNALSKRRQGNRFHKVVVSTVLEELYRTSCDRVSAGTFPLCALMIDCHDVSARAGTLRGELSQYEFTTNVRVVAAKFCLKVE